jgi:type IV pili sensor histidine kinase/response regulator
MRLSARFRFLHALALPVAMVGAVLAGCAITPNPPAPIPTADAPGASNATPEPEAIAETPAGLVPVIRRGRYTLVELAPEPAQRDLMRQVVEVAIPPAFDASVGDALRHVLLRTGYRLCDAADAAAMYALPLPAAHLRLGPLPLRDALLALAGPAWELSVDDADRQVCFTRHATSAQPATVTPVPAPEQPERAELTGVQP